PHAFHASPALLLLLTPHTPRSNLFPYTTLFRSCTKYALPYILKNKGTVAAISSIAGYRGLPGRSGYSASKFALQGWMEALRTELDRKSTRLNSSHVKISYAVFCLKKKKNQQAAK